MKNKKGLKKSFFNSAGFVLPLVPLAVAVFSLVAITIGSALLKVRQTENKPEAQIQPNFQPADEDECVTGPIVCANKGVTNNLVCGEGAVPTPSYLGNGDGKAVARNCNGTSVNMTCTAHIRMFNTLVECNSFDLEKEQINTSIGDVNGASRYEIGQKCFGGSMYCSIDETKVTKRCYATQADVTDVYGHQCQDKQKVCDGCSTPILTSTPTPTNTPTPTPTNTLTPTPTSTSTPTPTPTKYCPEVSGSCGILSHVLTPWGNTDLNWNDVSYEDWYLIRRDGVQCGSADKDSTSWTDIDSLTPGKTYGYSVNPVNDFSNGRTEIFACPTIPVTCPTLTPTSTPTPTETPTLTPTNTPTSTPTPCFPFLMLSYGYEEPNNPASPGNSQLYQIKTRGSSYYLEPIGDRSHKKLYNGIGFNPADNSVYATHQVANSLREIFKISPNTGILTTLLSPVPQSLFMPTGQENFQGTMLGDGKHYVVSDTLKITVLDISQDPPKVIASHPISNGGQMADIAYNPKDGKVYAYFHGAGTLSEGLVEIDPYSGLIIPITAAYDYQGIISPLRVGASYFDNNGVMYLYGKDGLTDGVQKQDTLFKLVINSNSQRIVVSKIQKLLPSQIPNLGSNPAPAYYNNSDAASCLPLKSNLPPPPASCGSGEIKYYHVQNDGEWANICSSGIASGVNIKIGVFSNRGDQNATLKIYQNGVNVTSNSWCNGSGRKIIATSTGIACQLLPQAYNTQKKVYFVDYNVPSISGSYDVYGDICCGECR